MTIKNHFAKHSLNIFPGNTLMRTDLNCTLSSMSQHTLNTKLFNVIKNIFYVCLTYFSLVCYSELESWLLFWCIFFASDPKNRKEKMKITSKQKFIFCHFMVGVFPQEIFMSFVFLLLCCWRCFTLTSFFLIK